MKHISCVLAPQRSRDNAGDEVGKDHPRMWTSPESQTRNSVCLGKTLDIRCMRIPPLTCENAAVSTIHTPYYQDQFFKEDPTDRWRTL